MEVVRENAEKAKRLLLHTIPKLAQMDWTDIIKTQQVTTDASLVRFLAYASGLMDKSSGSHKGFPVTSHERHSVSDHQQHDWLFNSLPGLISKNNIKASH